jgi:hypothetical protein
MLFLGEAKRSSKTNKQVYQKHNVGPDQNKWVAYASEISDNDLDFLGTLEAENGLWTKDRVGVTGDIGFCQISPYYHPHITNHESFYDPYWQLDKCLELYRGGTRFYGADHRHQHFEKFYLTPAL